MEIEKFRSVLIPLRSQLMNIAKNILDDADDAEDAVQEAYLRLWKIRAQLDSHPNIVGYALQTVKNISIDRYRQITNNVQVGYDNQLLDNSNTPDNNFELADSVNIIRKIIDSLPDLQNSIIIMRDIEGLELSEIAEITGININAVTTNLSRARKKVRDQFFKINNFKGKNYQ
jgi:RNA polymerase sigma-70 factor (ECF subfamily)